MDTVLVEITDKRAYQFLQGLEELNVIRLIDKNEKETEAKQESATAGFRGALHLTEEQYTDFQKHAIEIRNEWHNNI